MKDFSPLCLSLVVQTALIIHDPHVLKTHSAHLDLTALIITMIFIHSHANTTHQLPSFKDTLVYNAVL